MTKNPTLIALKGGPDGCTSEVTPIGSYSIHIEDLFSMITFHDHYNMIKKPTVSYPHELQSTSHILYNVKLRVLPAHRILSTEKRYLFERVTRAEAIFML